MDNTTVKKILFDVGDNDSIRRTKQKYEEFMKMATRSSALYANNSYGNNAVQQQKYLREQLEYLKQIRAENQKIFDENRKQLNTISREEATLKRRQSRGEDVDNELAEAAKARRKILSGTGSRTAHTYISKNVHQLENQDVLINKIDKTLKESTHILRSILSHDKETALEQIEAIEKSNVSTHEEKLAAQQAKHLLMSKDKDSQKKEDNSRSVLRDIISADNILSGLSSVKAIATSTDPITATRNVVGATSSTVNAIGDAFGPVGTIISRAFTTAGEILFEQNMQTLIAKQGLMKTMYGNRALMGGDLIMPSRTDMFGMSYDEFAGTFGQIATARGSRDGVHDIARSSLMLNRGAGIDQSAIQMLLEITRMNSDTDKNIENILGGIWEQGQGIFQNDRSFYNEFLTQGYGQLNKQFLQNQATVSSGSAFSAINAFNSVGGQFSARHANSMNLISSIQGSLSNPNGDIMDALTFTALRQSMPGASMGDIMIERQKGLSSPSYFRSVMSMLNRMGGSETSKMMQVSSAFGINYEAARDLVRNFESMPDMSNDELKGMIGNISQMAADNTTLLDQQNAKFTNDIIEGKNFEAIVKGVEGVLKAAFSGQSFTFDVTTNRLTQTLNNKTNTTKTPTQKITNEDWSQEHQFRTSKF